MRSCRLRPLPATAPPMIASEPMARATAITSSGVAPRWPSCAAVRLYLSLGTSSYNSPSSLSSALANLMPSTPETPSSVVVRAVAPARAAQPSTRATAMHLLIDDIEPRLDVGAVARCEQREVDVAEVEVV